MLRVIRRVWSHEHMIRKTVSIMMKCLILEYRSMCRFSSLETSLPLNGMFTMPIFERILKNDINGDLYVVNNGVRVKRNNRLHGLK